ncbi:PrsW family intramembrane metalloprotease [Sphingomonas sp. CGMCC 1.13654]|uniref:PrsW family intramembrane metalloprotease n=1 Tax=Sphingomonas chungangi TaxID=2683589 RepID=A0A838L3A0_9SPHN|nr:PrsW family glutamic-type intramembrane protease [Sphingomonas chungangi]MBA2933871.1 PrsW family intramembrane metalloprotease [Sphingomonas chungangi]MVW55201.1 PrsW family intramembrane metalloprotease [Sphingomonas chungangi]
MTIAEAMNWAIALLPVLLLLAAFEWLDVFHLMTRKETAKLLGLGGLAAVLAYPVSGVFLDALPLGFSVYSRFVAPWIEEALKGTMVVWLFWRNRIGYKIDAALSGFAIGAGFSLIENAIYLSRFSGFDPGIWLVRGLGTAVMHGGSVAIFATLAHQCCEHEMLRSAGAWRLHPFHFLPGYGLAVAIHTAFNQFPDQPLIAMLLTAILVPLALMAIFNLGGSEARNWLTGESARHQADLDELADGRLPDSDAGRAIGALAANEPRVIDYWRLMTEIVLGAERTMIERTADQRLDRYAEADRARFARLTELEAAIDRPTLLALGRLMPFSRNDLWEVSELREQLRRH